MENNYASLTIFSAFAKNSGVLRLKSTLEQHKANGGTITAFIGIDLDGTSYEALLNLYSLCDDLYVIHSENFSTIFHSKIYLLEKNDKAWCAVGSNNLTSGGLWSNFESCNIEEYSLPREQTALDSIHEIVQRYKDVNYECSTRISSIDDIDELLVANYITKEVSQRIENNSRQTNQRARQRRTHLFGTEHVSIPTLITITSPRPNTRESVPTHEIELAVELPDDNHQTRRPAFTNEQFWFEMRKSTGGS